ncbi:hypothetical protein SprV_0100269900 [Sparganum proliferum]
MPMPANWAEVTVCGDAHTDTLAWFSPPVEAVAGVWPLGRAQLRGATCYGLVISNTLVRENITIHVKRFHRQLKTVLRAVEDPGNWSDNLPLALLGIYAVQKSNLDCNSTELVFGTTLRLSGEMVTPTSRGADETRDNFVHRLQKFRCSLAPVPPRTPTTESYVEKDLDNCIHVFVRCDCVRQPLESPYERPFRVLARNAKTCRILRGDKEGVVSVDRVKAAFAEEPLSLSQGQKCADP